MIRKLLGVCVTTVALCSLAGCDSGNTNTTGNPNIEKPRENAAPIPAPDAGGTPAGKADKGSGG